MKSATVSAVNLAVIISASLLPPMAAQELPVILEVQTENQVIYVDDNPGPAQVARNQGPVPVNVATTPVNHFTNVTVGDIVAVNGDPVRGVVTGRGYGLGFNPAPAAGQAIADVIRAGFWQVAFEFLTPDGGQIGSIFIMGFQAGAPAPGSPPGSTIGNLAIVGGTGAFIGAKGTFNQAAVTNPPGQRPASVAEDPSRRRINGGGGRNRVLLQVFPMFRPEVLLGSNGPVVFHSDFSPVTAASPARAGENLIVYARGLGPTTPSVNPGDPFPSEPLAIATSPVEVLVNGRSAPAINQIGLPGTTDTYRVDFRVPDDTAAGTANIKLSAAWVTGAAAPIPVR